MIYLISPDVKRQFAAAAKKGQAGQPALAATKMNYTAIRSIIR
jgi:hypothetical protein